MLLRFVEYLARKLLRREVHLLFLTAYCCRAVLVQMKRERRMIAGGYLVRREAEPAAAHAEGDLICTYFNNCVLRCVQSVSGCVASKQ